MEHVVNHLRKKNRSFQRNVSDVHIIKGMVIVDATGIQYLPVSCEVKKNVATVTYVTTDSTTSTTAKLATVKSE